MFFQVALASENKRSPESICGDPVNIKKSYTWKETVGKWVLPDIVIRGGGFEK